MPADAVMPVSVVIERRVSSNPWCDHTWHAVGVLPRFKGARGTLLASGDGWEQYDAGGLDLELFRRETEGYLSNLSQNPPVVFVVLRRSESDDGLEYEPFLVTACPYEAMSYGAAGEEIVEGVPMPPEILAWVGEFVALHHVDEPFIKRKNKRHEDDYGGKAPVAERGRGLS